MVAPVRPLEIIFFKTTTGNEPVREWLLGLTKKERSTIGADILIVQWRWPIGKPLVDSLGDSLWEIRTRLDDKIARVFFIDHDQKLILLHGIIKKSQTTPKSELDLARARARQFFQLQTKIGASNEQKGTETIKKSPRRQ